MKTFKTFMEDAASNSIKSLSPYRVTPPLDVPYKGRGGRRLVDPLTGLNPGYHKAKKIKKKSIDQQYKDINNPKAPSETDLIKGTKTA